MAKKKKNTKKRNNAKKNIKKNVSKKQNNTIAKNIESKEQNAKEVKVEKNVKSAKKITKKDSKKTLSQDKKNISKNDGIKKIQPKLELPIKKSEPLKKPLLKNNKPKIKKESAKKKKVTKKDKAKSNEIKNKFKIKAKDFKLNKKVLILISIVCLIIAILIMYPYGTTNYKSEASGKILDIPRYSKLKEECCMFNVSFTSIRSATILKHELSDIINSYQKLSCDGKNYYYNKSEDYTVTDYGVKRGIIFNEIYITYGMGNSCEIDTTFRKIELLPNDYTIEESVKEGYYTITENGIKNEESYQNFLDKIEKKEEATFRLVKNNEDGILIVIDLKRLEDGRFKVTFDDTRDPNNKDGAIMAYVYNNLGIYKNKLYAFNGSSINKDMLKTKDVYYIMDVEE